MKNGDNSLLVASFKNARGVVVKTMCFNKGVNFNIGMVPEVAASYYLYSKKDDGKFSNDATCQMGKPLKEVVEQNTENKLLRTILENTKQKCLYLVNDGKEYIIPMDNNKLANNFDSFVASFKSDLENINTNDKQYTKKM